MNSKQACPSACGLNKAACSLSWASRNAEARGPDVACRKDNLVEVDVAESALAVVVVESCNHSDTMADNSSVSGSESMGNDVDRLCNHCVMESACVGEG